MKKILSLLIAVSLMAALASCGSTPADTTTATSTTQATGQTTAATTPGEATTVATTMETTTAATTQETPAQTTEATTAPPTVEVDPMEEYAENLVLHIDFDAWENGVVKDITGNGHDATAAGGVSTAESYDGSHAAQFKAAGDHLVIKNHDALNFDETESYTISFWYCFDENTSFTGWPCLVNKGLSSSSTTGYAATLSKTGNTKGINFSTSGTPLRTNNNINATNDMTLNEWHHFVAVQDAAKGTITTYVDGVRGSFSTFPVDTTTDTDLFIGAMNGTQRQFIGKLDDLMIYDCALDEAAIQGFVREEEKALINEDFSMQVNGYLPEGATLYYSNEETDGFLAGEGFTLSVKFKRATDSSAGIIVKKDAGKGTYGFSLDEQNRLIMHVGDLKYYADAAITDTEWHHAVMIQNPESNTLLFYLDGVLQGSTKPYNQTVPSVSRDLAGEGTIIVSDGANKTQIDDLQLYNYAVSEDEILAGYKTVDAMGRGVYHYVDEATGDALDLPYRVYLPSDYDESKTYPVLLFLHGHGETGIDNTQNIRVNGGANKLFENLIEKDEVIIIAPQATCDDGGDREWFNSSNHKWNSGSRTALPETPTLAMRAAMSLLDDIVASGKIDTKRVYAGGISMGGYGTWELLTRKSDVFAAAIPLCGAGIPSEAKTLTDIAIWAFHGTADTTVPSTGTSDMEAAIKAAGGTKMKTTYLAGVGHSCWDDAYATAGLVDWLLSQSK